MTRAISGRPARSIANRFTAIGESVNATMIPPYPIAYDVGKALHQAAQKNRRVGLRRAMGRASRAPCPRDARCGSRADAHGRDERLIAEIHYADFILSSSANVAASSFKSAACVFSSR